LQHRKENNWSQYLAGFLFIFSDEHLGALPSIDEIADYLITSFIEGISCSV
jgi:hypothetical protein